MSEMRRIASPEYSIQWLLIIATLDVHLDSCNAHQHSAAASAEAPQAIGYNLAARTRPIHLPVGTCELPKESHVTCGKVHHCAAASELIAKQPNVETIIADKGYDSQHIHDLMAAGW